MPTTLDEACTILADDHSVVPIAGGTDLMVHWPSQHDSHEKSYLDLSGIPELGGIRWTDDELIVGATATYWQTTREPRVAEAFPLLVEAARQIGAVQIQTRGTWGGNIVNASPAADGVPVLMAYDAKVELVSHRNKREVVALSEFYTGYKAMRRSPEQLVHRIRIPRHRYDFQFFEKIGSRRAQAITKVGLAMTNRGGVWAVAVNSAAATVRRCPAIERMLSQAVDVSSPADFLPAIGQDLSPIDDIRSTGAYRLHSLSRVLYYTLREQCEWMR